ncbi:VOC family protein [Nitrospinota bacterium]
MAVYGTYHHVHLVSRDPEAAAEWYVKALGAEISSRTESKGAVSVRLKVGDANLSVRGVRPEETASEGGDLAIGLHHIGLMVDDIEAAIRQVVDNGGEMTDPPHTGTSGNTVAFVRCPENLHIEFLQPKD